MKLKSVESGDRVYDYQDIYLIPDYSEVESRSDVDIGLKWGKFDFSTPIVPANMSSVIDEKIAKYCAFHQIPYFYHRFGDTFDFVKKANEENWPFISISVGVKQVDRDLLNKIHDAGFKLHAVLIDVAHGYSSAVSRMLSHSNCLDYYTGAGNIWGDLDSMEYLREDGAEFTKIGLAKGAGCSTYNTTGFGSPMFSAAMEAGKWAKIPIIIDGGIRNNGDIVKAIRGFMEHSEEVPLVMAGSLFAACIDAPGESIYKNRYAKTTEFGLTEFNGDVTHKGYYGSASLKNKSQTGQPIKHIEGFEVELPCNGFTFEQKIQEIKESIQSAVSYSGGEYLEQIAKAKWVTIK